jgi:hypothetical protein
MCAVNPNGAKKEYKVVIKGRKLITGKNKKKQYNINKNHRHGLKYVNGSVHVTVAPQTLASFETVILEGSWFIIGNSVSFTVTVKLAE